MIFVYFVKYMFFIYYVEYIYRVYHVQYVFCVHAVFHLVYYHHKVIIEATMNQTNLTSTAGQFSDTQVKYLTKLLPLIQRRGFSQVRIEDIVHAMDISKATFYKSFTSKEDVIAHIVEMVIAYFQQTITVIDESTLSYEERFQRIFEQSVFIATYLTDVFLRDLQQTFPSLLERIKQAQRERQHHREAFFKAGIAAGIFQPIPHILVILQDEVLLHSLLDPIFLMEHDLTLRSALEAYYEIQKYQWCVAAVRERLDDTVVKAYIATMANKIALNLRMV